MGKARKIIIKYHQIEDLTIVEGRGGWSANGKWQNGEIDVLCAKTAFSSHLLSFNYFNFDSYERIRFNLIIDNSVMLFGYKSGTFRISDCDNLDILCKVLDVVNYIHYLQSIEYIRYLFN